MIRILIGSLIAAAATFLVGLLMFATPMSDMGFKVASHAVQVQVQEALRALPESGTYFIPYGETPEAQALHEAGPTAVIQVNQSGAKIFEPMTMVKGYVHMVIAMLLLGIFLWMLRGALPTFASRVMPLLFLAVLAAFWTRLGEPIWWRTDWANAIYSAASDVISLAVGGLIMAAFIPKAVRR